MRSWVGLLLLVVATDLRAEKCEKVNFKYKFCHEDWVYEAALKPMIKGLDDKPLRNNLWQRSYTKNDTLYITLEVRSDDAIDELSSLPGEFKNEGMEEVLGTEYAPYLGILYHTYVFSKVKESNDYGKRPSEDTKLYLKLMDIERLGFKFNLLDNQGKLAKEYDLTTYGLNAYMKIFKKLTGQNSEDED